MAQEEELPQFPAQKIIESLKSGIPNINSISSINVDIPARKMWFDDVTRDLESYIKSGGSKVRFISGSYGNGKTHLLSMIKQKAKEMQYAVSYVTAECVRMNRYDELYREIMKNLEVKNRQENVFKFLIENKALAIKEEVKEAFEDRNQFELSKEVRRKIKEFAGNLAKSSANFQSAIKHYMTNFVEASNQKDWEAENETILRWFHGEKLPLREVRLFQIYALNDKDNARESIKSLTDIVRALGFAGIIILIDEAERILTQSKTVAQAAYNNIRHLLDSVDGGGEINHAESCYIFIASTVEMLREKNGYQSYTALYDRIKTGLAGEYLGNLINPRAIIIDLENELAQVKIEDLEEIIRKIIRIHGIAYQWEPSEYFDSDVIHEVAQRAFEFRAQKAPLRASVELMVEILDIGQFNPDHLKSLNVRKFVLKSDTIKTSLWE